VLFSTTSDFPAALLCRALFCASKYPKHIPQFFDQFHCPPSCRALYFDLLPILFLLDAPWSNNDPLPVHIAIQVDPVSVSCRYPALFCSFWFVSPVLHAYNCASIVCLIIGSICTINIYFQKLLMPCPSVFVMMCVGTLSHATCLPLLLCTLGILWQILSSIIACFICVQWIL